jgi:uncharacterized protein (DUF2147 family)
MRHHAIAAAMGLVTAAVLAPCSQSQAASADPTGYWYKPDAERESKIQVFKCGKAKSQLCAKIIWLKDPNDSKGKTLHDVRNEDPSMRARPIVGLTIFSGLAPSAPDTWAGQIYNPEDGHIYAATLTMVSRKEINLKGCKAWLLCGEKEWLRTTAPQELTPAIPAATPQIEASAAPSVPSGAAAPAAPASPSTAEASASAAPSGEAAAAPGPQTVREASAEPQSASAEPQPVALPKAELATPAAPPAEQDTRPGYGFLNASTAPETTARVSGENVSSMFDMTKPIAGSVAPVPAAATPIAATAAADPAPAQTGTQAAGQADAGVPLPTQKPKAKTIATASAKPAAKTVTSTSAKPAEQAAPAPRDTATAEADAADTSGADSAQATTAEASMADTAPMTRRQRRLLRKQQRQEEPFLPWLQQ